MGRVSATVVAGLLAGILAACAVETGDSAVPIREGQRALHSRDEQVYAVSGEAALNWLNGVRVGPLDEDHIVGFIPAFPADDRPNRGAGAGGQDVAVDADGNVYVSLGPHGLQWVGSSFGKYSVQG